MPSLVASGVAFSFSDSAPLLEQVDLVLPAGWTALVGANGAGKTTLLRLLAGELAPSAGRVRAEPPLARVVLCGQEVEQLSPEVEALAAGEGGALAHELRGRLRLDPAALSRWPTLSPGERKRWQIAAALALEPDALLLDEPTNHLDPQARGWLLGALRRFGGVGVLVSHDRALLEELTSRTVRVHRGAATLYPGAYGAAKALWEGERAALLEAHGRAAAEEERQARRLGDLRRAAAAASRERSRSARMKGAADSDARTMGADRRAERGEARLSRGVEKARRALDEARGAAAGIEVEREPGGAVWGRWERAPNPVLLSLDAPALRAGGTELLGALSLVVRREDRIHLAGPNGAGKSTLLAALLASGRLPPGRVLHLPQELDDAGLRAALDDVRALAPEPRGRVLQTLAALGVEPGRLLASARPSPGEARKLLLARGLGTGAWLLALDEPTNHLDLPSIERLEAALRAWPGALLVVTHDAALARACTGVRWRLEGRKICVEG